MDNACRSERCRKPTGSRAFTGINVRAKCVLVWSRDHPDTGDPVTPAETTPPAETPPAATAPAQAGSFNPATAEAITPAETAPVDGLKISSQSWRRGGLGSNALITFTLRNGNDYAVKDIEISCSFARRDGSHLTNRRRVIRDTVNMKSRKIFARMHIGFVNINANKAKCSLVAASRL
jgi:hypothetical protein